MRSHFGLPLLLACGLGLWGCGGESDGPFTRRVFGEKAVVAGQEVEVWETQDLEGRVIEVGYSMTKELIDNPPVGEGPGPAGAFAVLRFPTATRSQTFFDHFELHWNSMGHEPPFYMKPHWDLHYYGVPVDEVWNALPPDPGNPHPDQIPSGYLYPGSEALVPQMGVHAVPLRDLEPGFDFEHTFIYGYYGSQTTFVEPMITQEFLDERQGYVLEIPQPARLGRATRFPTRFTARYIHSARKWEFVLSHFVSMN